jgi:hypothetical protein
VLHITPDDQNTQNPKPRTILWQHGLKKEFHVIIFTDKHCIFQAGLTPTKFDGQVLVIVIYYPMKWKKIWSLNIFF